VIKLCSLKGKESKKAKWNKREQKLRKVGEINAPKNSEAIQESRQRRQGKEKERHKWNVRSKLRRQSQTNEHEKRTKRKKRKRKPLGWAHGT
jgi:hypothetical protein